MQKASQVDNGIAFVRQSDNGIRGYARPAALLHRVCGETVAEGRPDCGKNVHIYFHEQI